MTHRLAHLVAQVLAALGACTAASAFAGQELLAVDTPFRAKLVKEKVRIGAQQREAEERGQSADKARCGSQSIGNIDTGGRIGTAPREVFVFAPNAINIVDRGSCH